MPDPGAGTYERELGGVQARLSGIETTLSGLSADLKQDRDEAWEWRDEFRQSLEEHARTTAENFSKITTAQAETQQELDDHKGEFATHRRLIWRILLGGGGGGGTLFVAWNQAKAAVTSLFK